MMAADSIDFADFMKVLLEEDLFVTSLINTIPPKIYFDQDVNEKLTADKHSAMDTFAEGLKRNFPKQVTLSSRNKHKRARLDPHHHKLVTEIQRELNAKVPKRVSHPPGFSPGPQSENIEEVKEKLKEHVAKLQGNRKALKSGTQDKRLDHKMKEKLHLKKKINARRRKRGKSLLPIPENLLENQKSPLDGGEGKSTIMNGEKKSKPAKNEEKATSVYNKGKLIYGKFEFGEDGDGESNKKRPRNRKSKNLKRLLQNAESEKEKIETLKQEDREKADAVIQKNAWHRAIQKAEGVKLKDDPAILKKTIKKQEKIKKKHSEKWKARVEHTEKLKKNRQEKRTKNIQAMKKAKIDKKIKRAKKKGRILPGL